MIAGLDKFKEHFKDHTDKYVLIGGAACDLWFSDVGAEFRATNDLDLILVVEALDESFFLKFWDFIIKGGYGKKQIEEKDKKYYRFKEPEDKGFPFQIELFSRIPDLIRIPEDAHLTHIPAGEEFSNLSAIILEDEFYKFVMENRQIKDDYSLLNTPGIICLKAKAYFDLTMRKEKGDEVSDRDIRKHRNDIFRLVTLLTKSEKINLPDTIKTILNNFLRDLENNPPDYKSLKKDLKKKGIEANLSDSYVIERLSDAFEL